MKLYDDNINAGLEKPKITFTMDNLNSNLKANYPQLPGQQAEKKERKILQAGSMNVKLPDFGSTMSSHRKENLSVEIRNRPKLGHLPNTDMRIRAHQEMNYY